MGRLVSLLFALVLIIALVVALDPDARRKAADMVQDLEPTLQKWDDTIVVNIPSVDVDIDPVDQTSTPVPTVTPFATPVVDNNDDPEKDSSDEPIIVINWDALGDSLRKIWESLQVKIDIDSRGNK